MKKNPLQVAAQIAVVWVVLLSMTTFLATCGVIDMAARR